MSAEEVFLSHSLSLVAVFVAKPHLYFEKRSFDALGLTAFVNKSNERSAQKIRFKNRVSGVSGLALLLGLEVK